jgi:hypothetical protein
MPSRWRAYKHPVWFRQAMCIHQHEGAWTSETGNGYSGGMQFTPYTWASVGGRGLPSRATPREQLYRAWLVWDRDRGRLHDGLGSWREWGTAGMCGLD